jgi:hypothetical protein
VALWLSQTAREVLCYSIRFTPLQCPGLQYRYIGTNTRNTGLTGETKKSVGFWYKIQILNLGEKIESRAIFWFIARFFWFIDRFLIGFYSNSIFE